MNNSDKLKAFAEHIAIPLANTDNVKWPIRSGKIISFINDIYADEFIKDLKILISTVPKNKWYLAFYNSLSIWKISHHVINGLCKLGISKEEIAQDIILMCDVLNEITHGNWLSTKSHRILSATDVENVNIMYSNYHNKNSSNLLATASAFLWAYSDTLFFQGREICCERHGLYSTNSGKKLFITDVKHIDEAAHDLWPMSYKKMNIESIRIVLMYDNKFEITIDPYNNTDLINGSFTESCCGGALIIDGNVLSESELSVFLNELANRIHEQTTIVNALTKDALIRQYINIFWYRKKRLSSVTNNNWRPLQDIYQKVNANAIETNTKNNLPMPSYQSIVNKYDFSKFI